MPFTLAHPAASVPLKPLLRRYGVLSALVLGAMTPDFAYWLPLGAVPRAQSHSLEGLFWFCLPSGLAAYAAFHLLLKRPATALLPAPLRRRLIPFVFDRRALPKASLAAVLLSLLVGAVTHLAWDSFTHYGAPGVQAIPVLSREVGTYWGYTLRLYKLVQHASTLIGLGLLASWSWRWLRAQPLAPGPDPWPITPPVRVALAAGIGALSLVIAVLSGFDRAPDVLSLRSIQIFLERAVIDGLAVLVGSLLALGCIGRAIELRELFGGETRGAS